MSMRTSQKRTSQPCRNFYATHGFREAIEEMEIPDFKTYARAIEATHGALTIGEEKRFNTALGVLCFRENQSIEFTPIFDDWGGKEI